MFPPIRLICKQNHIRQFFAIMAAFNNSVTWAARGLAILYEDFSFDNYNPELAKEWLKKFEGV